MVVTSHGPWSSGARDLVMDRTETGHGPEELKIFPLQNPKNISDGDDEKWNLLFSESQT